MLAAGILIFSACNDDNNDIESSSIELSSESIQAGPEGGSYDLSVKSSGEWRVSALCDWLTFSSLEGKSGDKLTVTVAPNGTSEVKTAVFKVFTGSAVKTVTVTSAQAFVVQLLSDPAYKATSDAEDVSISFNTNVSELKYEFSDGGDKWITVGERVEAFGKTVVNFKLSRSSEFKDRVSKVTISGADVTAPAELTFTQAQRDTAFVVGMDKILTGLEAWDKTIDIRSNVDITLNDFPTWIENKSFVKGTDKDSDGLIHSTLKVHADASAGSRLFTLSFLKESARFGFFSIKQQNPNPIWATIPDAGLREVLAEKGFIIAEEGVEKAEVVGDGMTATSVEIYSNNIKSIYGMAAFPKLTSISVKNCTYLTKLDLTDCANLTSVTVQLLSRLEEVKLGDNPVESFAVGSGSYFFSYSLAISGSKLKNLDVSSTSWYVIYYENLESIDVSGCPAITSLKSRRESWGSAAKYDILYMSKAQIDAVAAGTLKVDKSPKVTITEKK